MITVENYNLLYNTQHLLEPKPTNYQEVVGRLRKLDCRLFYNIISSPKCRYEIKFSEGRIKDDYKDMDPESRFKNIFTERRLYANPKSYFVNKLNVLPKDCDEIKSVSFTLADHRDLPKHFAARGSEFGICFFHDFLQNNGIRPVEYLNQNDDVENQKLVFNSPHLIEVSSKTYDMSWENEWRLNFDLTFTAKDIAFVIVPKERHYHFVEWFENLEDFDETRILTSLTYKSHIDHLIFYPQQTDNSWNQIELFRRGRGRGMKIDPDEFDNLEMEKKAQFSIRYGRALDCLAKNTILSSYEYAYTNRFLRFAKKVNDKKGLGALFQHFNTIEDNLQEPKDAQRDLIIVLFEKLYSMYPRDFDLD